MSSKSKYREAGVDIDKGNQFVDEIKSVVKKTHGNGVLNTIGGFASHFEIDLEQFPSPVLVSSTDGVGTKLAVAHLCNKHDTIGIDLVAMCVNDLIVGGATPLCFLDYFAVGKLNIEMAKNIVKGIAEGCLLAGCSLVGGETAEMPGLYRGGDYDLAGFATGIVNKDQIITGDNVTEGNVIIGLSSNGIHSNGYSLVRKVCFTDNSYKVNDFIEEFRLTLGEELLKPTRIYVKPILKVLESHTVNGMVHNTGGGFYDNIPRILPDGFSAEIESSAWTIPPVFHFLAEKGNITKEEMFRTFNMGLGYFLIVDEKIADEIMKKLSENGESPYRVGRITKNDSTDQRVIIH